MEQDKKLESFFGQQKKATRKEATKISDAINQLMEKQISPAQSRFGPLVEEWNRIIPREMQQHCNLADISGGQLKVSVDSPAYRYELQICSPSILEKLQENCPRAKIRKIKFVLESKIIENRQLATAGKKTQGVQCGYKS